MAAVYDTSVSHHEETAARLAESIAEQDTDASGVEEQQADLILQIATLESETAEAAEEDLIEDIGRLLAMRIKAYKDGLRAAEAGA